LGGRIDHQRQIAAAFRRANLGSQVGFGKFAEIEVDRRTLENLGIAIDQGGQLAGRVDLEKFWGLVLALFEVYRNDLLVDAAFIKHPFGYRRATPGIVIKLHDITSHKKTGLWDKTAKINSAPTAGQ
jgi:hypothetical protein